MTTEVTKVEPALPEELDSNPEIEITDQEVSEAASRLGYAVIKGRNIKDMQTIGKSVGGNHIHMGRGWLILAASTCQDMLDQLDQIIKEPDEPGDDKDALKMKQKVVDSMVTSAKEMIASGDKVTHTQTKPPLTTTGFGPGMPASPIFPVQINVQPDSKDQVTIKSHVERSNVGPKSSGDTGSNPSEQGKEND